MKQKVYKTPYFWGFLFAAILLTANASLIPFVKHKEKRFLLGKDYKDLVVTNLEGEQITLAELSDSKNLLVNFWHSSCPPCVRELKTFEEAYQSINKEFVFVLLSTDKIEKIQKFQDEKGYSFYYAHVPKLKKVGIKRVPTSIILDSDLNPRDAILGEIEFDDASKFISFLRKSVK